MRTKQPTRSGKRVLVKSKTTVILSKKLDHAEESSSPSLLPAVSDREASLARFRELAKVQHAHTKALFAQWAEEDATDDPEELKRRDEEHLELKLALNANRKATGERLPYPELEEEQDA